MEKRETLNVPQRGEVWLEKAKASKSLGIEAIIINYYETTRIVCFVQPPCNTVSQVPLDEFCAHYISAEPVKQPEKYKGMTAEQWWAAYVKQGHEIEQILGKALGYPPLFPVVSQVDDGMVCVGEHTCETVAMEAAALIVKLQSDNKGYTEMLSTIYAPILAPVVDALKIFTDTANKYCDGLLAEMERLKNAR